MLKCFARLSQQADAGKLKIADTKLPVPTGRSGGSAARGRDVKFFAQLSFKKADAGKLKIADTKLSVPTGRSGGSAPRSAT